MPYLRLRQLSPAQLKDRELELSILKPAGFTATDDERSLEHGFGLDRLVSLTRSNGSLEITVELQNDKPLLDLKLSKLEGFDSPYIRLAIEHEGRLEELLKLIVGFKDQINDQNYKDGVRQLLARFPSIYADFGEEGLRKLVSGKDLDLGAGQWA